MSKERAKRKGLSISHRIGILFGGLWAVAGCTALAGVSRTVGILAAGALTAALLLRSFGPSPPGATSPERPLFRRRPYLIAVLLEVVAIVLATSLLPRYGGAPYLIEVVGFIVGLHFIGLWKASGSNRFLPIAASMCIVSLFAALVQQLARSSELGLRCTGLGNALVLWVGATSTPKR